MNTKPSFSAAVKAAEGDAAAKWLTMIEQAALEGNWHAAAWKLERRYPRMYGRTVQEQEHGGEVKQRVVIEYVNDWRGKGKGARDGEGGDDA